MADKRKSFRACRLAFGRHSLLRLCVVASLALAAGAVYAQDAGLRTGAQSIAAGKYQDAVRQLSAAINASNISASDAAKALYLRGIAYRKLGQSAQAVADLGAAIWLGLPQADRAKALVNRALAFQAAGLSKESEAEIASARRIAGSSEVDKLIAEGGGSLASAAAIASSSSTVVSGGNTSWRDRWLPSFGRSTSDSAAPSAPAAPAAPTPPTGPIAQAARPASPPTRGASTSPQTTTASSKPAATPGSWDTSVASAEDQPSSSSSGGSRLSRWFGSIRGSSSSEPAPAPATQTAAASPPPSKPRSAPPAAASSSSWSTTTQSEESSGSESKRSWRIFGRSSEPEPAAQPAATQSASGGYQVQLANSRSEAEAQALWKKASQTQGVQGMTPQIEKIDIGNFGTFYSLKIGPFPDKAQSVKVCNALKRSGIDCSLATL
jgi:SPOR domain